jgi:hypothetical protein
MRGPGGELLDALPQTRREGCRPLESGGFVIAERRSTKEVASQLAGLPTHLSDLGELQSKQLVNWGYAICDRCVRIHYNVPNIRTRRPRCGHIERHLLDEAAQ